MKRVIYLYSVEPECTGCVIGVWCDTKEQVLAAIEAGEERIHTMRDNYDEDIAEYGYTVLPIAEV